MQTGSLRTYQKKYGHYQGAQYYNLLHSKAKGNIINLCLHLPTADIKTLFADQPRKKNTKLIRTVKIKTMKTKMYTEKKNLKQKP